jgi:hypothetical protein
MEVVQDVTSLLKELNELLAPYTPPRNTWNPADESLYKPLDLYRVPFEEAKDMQLKAIKYTFAHHNDNNDFYHKYCEMRNVHPDDIKTHDDLDKIPLIPDTTFKEYPSGKDFAYWLAIVFTGELPKIVVKSSNPSYDDVINAFDSAGLMVTYSSGTSGRVTVISRDLKTFQAAEYAFAKLTGCMTDQTIHHIHTLSADHFYLLSPNSTRTNLFIGKASNPSLDLLKDGDVQYALDNEITMESLQMAMRGERELKTEAATISQSEIL